MAILNMAHWYKSYMLEFMEGEVVKECFTFSVPPESEEFTYGNRVSETKTFGGSVFDQYGNDTIKISLSGSTINEERKLIFKGGKELPKYLTGEQEIAELQKLIKKYNDIYREGNQKSKIYLYDLSKMSVMQLAAGIVSRNYWQVIVKDFKVKRDKGKPHTYNYTLEFLGVEDPKKTSLNIDLGFVSSIASAINSAAETIENIATGIEFAMAGVSEAAIQTRKVIDKTAAFFDKNRSVRSRTFSVLGLGDKALRMITGNTNNTFYNSAKDLLAITKTLTPIKEAEEKKEAAIEHTKYVYLSFNSNGGSYTKTEKIKYSDKAKEPDAPTKEDYKLLGWFDQELETEFDFDAEIVENITLYAKWELSVATVRFNSRNGSPVPLQKVEVGENAITPENPTRSGYSFDYWATDIDALNKFDFGTLITSDITLYAAWKRVSKVTFETYGGSEVQEQIVPMDGLAIYPLTPEKEGYTFSGWYTDSSFTENFDFYTNITQDITLHALFVKYANTVTFDSNEGSSVESQQVKIGEFAIRPTNPERDGYDFVYWCTDKALTNEFKFNSTPVNSFITLYAKWQLKTHTITFDTLGGSEIDAQTVQHKEKVIFPEVPTKEGVIFVMWQTKETVEIEIDDEMVEEDVYNEFDFETEIIEDLTLYALWFGE